MKKLLLLFFISTIFVMNIIKTSITKTEFGPLQIITVYTGMGISKFIGTIYLGKSSDDIIYLKGQYITKGLEAGDKNIKKVMAIDNNGQIVTGTLIALGSENYNQILCPESSENITIQSAENTNIVIKSNQNIQLLSTNNLITNSMASPVLLALDSNNNIITSNKADKFIFGNTIDSNKAYILVDNTKTNLIGIALDTSQSSNSNILLNAGKNNNIIISGNGINNASLGKTNILVINDTGAIQTINESIPINYGNLSAAEIIPGQTITLGYTDLNQIHFINNSGNLIINAKNKKSDIFLNADKDINIFSSNLNPTINLGSTCTTLALDKEGNIITSEKHNKFIYGNNNPGKNYIEIDNINSANGITIGAKNTYLVGQGLSPAKGMNLLAVDNTGKISILLSSKKYKENIKPLIVNEKDLENLTAVSYNYIGEEGEEYGFIAEELISNELLKNVVLFDKDGSIMSLNYNAIFVMITDQFLKTKKNLQIKIDSLQNKIDILENEIILLKKELEQIYQKLN